jgi:hypothetical protein
VEDSCGHSNEPSDSIKCWEVLQRLHLSRRVQLHVVIVYLVMFTWQRVTLRQIKDALGSVTKESRPSGPLY